MKSWIRQVIPTTGLIVGTLTLYLMFTFSPYVVFQLTGGTDPPIDIFQGGMVVLTLAAVLYGGYRVWLFHPLFNKEYRDWLKNSPWTMDQQLLGGPLNLVMQDAVIIAVLTGLSLFHDNEFPLLISELFVGAYVVFCSFSFLMTRQWPHAYAIAFAISGFIYFRNSPLMLILVLLLLLAIARHGLTAALSSFRKWDMGWLDSTPLLQTNAERAKEIKQEKILGWPHDRLTPKQSTWQVPLAWSFALSLLVGWWTYLPLSVLPPGPNGDIPPILTFNFFVLGLVAVRIFNYLLGYAPPISIWGRIRTGRLIIPRYDVVFVAPFAVLTLAAFAAYCLAELHSPFALVMGLLHGSCLFITLSTPPKRDDWRLTGNHRIVPGVAFQKQELQQTQ